MKELRTQDHCGTDLSRRFSLVTVESLRSLSLLSLHLCLKYIWCVSNLFLFCVYSNPLLLLLSTIIIQFYSTVLLLVAKDYDIQHLIVETLRNIPETPCHINLNLVLTFDVVVVLTWWLLLYYYIIMTNLSGKPVKNQNHIFFQNCYAFSLLILHGFVCFCFSLLKFMVLLLSSCNWTIDSLLQKKKRELLISLFWCRFIPSLRYYIK